LIKRRGAPASAFHFLFRDEGRVAPDPARTCADLSVWVSSEPVDPPLANQAFDLVDPIT